MQTPNVIVLGAANTVKVEATGGSVRYLTAREALQFWAQPLSNGHGTRYVLKSGVK